MPRAGHRELDALKYPILSVLSKGTDFLQTQWSEWCVWLFHTCETRKRVPLSSPGHPATKLWNSHDGVCINAMVFGVCARGKSSADAKYLLRSLQIRSLNLNPWGYIRVFKQPAFCRLACRSIQWDGNPRSKLLAPLVSAVHQPAKVIKLEGNKN